MTLMCDKLAMTSLFHIVKIIEINEINNFKLTKFY